MTLLGLGFWFGVKSRPSQYKLCKLKIETDPMHFNVNQRELENES